MAGLWSSPAQLAPFNVGTMLLLTDGTVLAQDDFTVNWWRLRPDQSGSYRNGTWTQAASASRRRLYFASAVLADGRVFVAGGEYSDDAGKASDLLAAEIYDPVADRWTNLPVPTGWTVIGDAPCCVLPDGTVLLGNIATGECAIFDPAQNAWRPTGAKLNGSATEESWTLLPDGSVLTADCRNHPASERYVGGAWRSEGTVPGDLVPADNSLEIGPALLLPSGAVFALGATGHTALFTPAPLTATAGSWAAGPDLPTAASRQFVAKDAPACLLPNGCVLFAASTTDGSEGDYGSTAVLFEYDPKPGAPPPAPLAAQPGNADGVAPYATRLLLLPDGSVAFATSTPNLTYYAPDGTPDPSWAPIVTQAPQTVTPGDRYVLRGRQLNGLSQACAYGDDASYATNYPLIRLRARTGTQTIYCRSFGHSTMGVATGAADGFTNFDVPAGIAPGEYGLEVVVNGIASVQKTVKVVLSTPAQVPAPATPEPLRNLADDRRLQEEMFWRDLNEVHLLMDFVSGQADRSLAELKDVPNPTATAQSGAADLYLTPQQALNQVCLIRFPPVGPPEEKARQAALLLLVKDRLNALASPARGMTIAFTSMFTGTGGASDAALQSGWFARAADYWWPAPETPASGYAAKAGGGPGFALASYPNLEAQSRNFRSLFLSLPYIAIVWLILTALTYWDVAMTSRTLQTLVPGITVSDQDCNITGTGTDRKQGKAPAKIAVACKALYTAETANISATDIIARDDRAAVMRIIWHPVALVVHIFGPQSAMFAAAPTQAKTATPNLAKRIAVDDPNATTPPCSAAQPCDLDADVTAFATVIVAVFTEYVLPMMFGVLGTLAGLMRAISSKVRDSTLSPRDYRLTIPLILLGAVAGLAVGLLITPTSAASAVAGTPLTLSAAALAFLAGYGADGFFGMIDLAIKRVFNLEPQSPAQK